MKISLYYSMSLEIIQFIKSLNENQIIISFHAKDRFADRNLNKETICTYLFQKEILKIEKQNENLYKLWFDYNSKEVLRIVLKIKESYILIITVIKEKKKNE